MPGRAAKVVISERQQELLQKIVSSRKASQRLIQRAKIILLAFEGWDNQHIASEVDLGRDQVGIWRRRWKENFDRLVVIECSETGASFQRATQEILSDAPRSGSGGKFATEQIAGILAVLGLNACGKDDVMPSCDEFQPYQAVVEGQRIVSPDGLDPLDEYKEMPIPKSETPARPAGSACRQRDLPA